MTREASRPSPTSQATDQHSGAVETPLPVSSPTASLSLSLSSTSLWANLQPVPVLFPPSHSLQEANPESSSSIPLHALLVEAMEVPHETDRAHRGISMNSTVTAGTTLLLVAGLGIGLWMVPKPQPTAKLAGSANPVTANPESAPVMADDSGGVIGLSTPESFSPENSLSTKTVPRQTGSERNYTSSALAQRVVLTFGKNPKVAGLDTIWVAQSKSTVVLKGQVPSQDMLDKLVAIAGKVRGVTAVDSTQLTVD